MSEVQISRNSWLNLSRLLEFNGKVFWENVSLPQIPLSEEDKYINISQEQTRRLDLLAYEYYGDPELMWVILLANNKDLPNQFLEGELVRLPSPESIEKLLRSSN